MVTFDDARSLPAYELHPAVTRRALAQAVAARGALHAIALNLQRLKVLRRSIKASGPQVVISFPAHHERANHIGLPWAGNTGSRVGAL